MSSFSGPYNEGVTTRGLVLSYDANDLGSYPGTGSDVIDISRNGRNGTATGITYNSNFNSVYLNGSSYLSVPSNSAFALNTADFTVEAWIYPQGSFGTYWIISTVTTTGGLWFGKNGANFVFRAYAVADQIATTTMPEVNTWTHVAVTRSGSTMRMFYNGVQVATSTSSYNFVQGALEIGRDGSAAFATGYVSNFRIVKGVALYTSNFTPLTERLQPVSGTSILTCQNGLTDSSTNNLTVTANVSAAANTLSPFKKNYKNFTFNGSTSNITSTNTTAFPELTVECWYKGTKNTRNHLWNITGSIYCDFNDTRGLWIYWDGSGNNAVRYSAIGDFTDGEVKHLVFVHSNNTTSNSVYLNGVKLTPIDTLGTQTFTASTGNGNIVIGGTDNAQPFAGEVYSFKVYSRALTPTEIQVNYDADCEKYGLAPIQSTATVASSGLILYYDVGNESSYPKSGTTIYDLSSSKINGTLANGVGYSSDNGGILSFDGVDDKITFPSTTLQTPAGATIEVWFKTPSTTRYQDIFDTDDTAGGVWIVTQSGSIKTSFTTTTGAISTSYSADTWYHVVLTGSGTTAYQYINGVQTGTGTQTVPKTISIATARIGNVDGDRASEYLLGNVASFKIYNRQLSAQEIQQNFEAQRTRFRV